MGKNRTKTEGYTIAEVLVIIVVMGILASIAYVGYSSWRKNITIAQLKSDLTQASAAMENYRNFNDKYPTSVTQVFTPSDGVAIGGGDYDGQNKYQLTALKDKIFYYLNNIDKTPKEGLGEGIVTPGLVVYLDVNSGRSYNASTNQWTNLIDGSNAVLAGDIIFKNGAIKSLVFTGLECTAGGDKCLDKNNSYYFEHTVKMNNPIKQSTDNQNWTVVASLNMNKNSATNYQELLNFNRAIEVSWWPLGSPLPANPADPSRPRIWLNEGPDYVYENQDDALFLKDKWSLLSYVFSSKDDIGKIFNGKNSLAVDKIRSNNVNPSGLPEYIRLGYKFDGDMGAILIYNRNFLSQYEIDQNFIALCSIYHYASCP